MQIDQNKSSDSNSVEARENQFKIEKAEWDKIKESNNSEDLYNFLYKYPNGPISQLANFKLESLAKAKIQTQADKYGLIQKLGESRYRLGDKWKLVRKDDYTGKILSKSKVMVNRIENSQVFASSTDGESYILTTDGGILRTNALGNTFTFDPPLNTLPGGELAIGKKWINSTTQTSLKDVHFRTDEYKILSYEDITIPAGTFKAFKIQVKGWSGNNRIDNVSWTLPDWGIPLKVVRRIFPQKGPAIKESTELEYFVRGT